MENDIHLEKYIYNEEVKHHRLIKCFSRLMLLRVKGVDTIPFLMNIQTPPCKLSVLQKDAAM